MLNFIIMILDDFYMIFLYYIDILYHKKKSNNIYNNLARQEIFEL